MGEKKRRREKVLLCSEMYKIRWQVSTRRCQLSSSQTGQDSHGSQALLLFQKFGEKFVPPFQDQTLQRWMERHYVIERTARKGPEGGGGL